MNAFGLGLKYFFIDLVGGIVRWPVWWYTKGLFLTFQWATSAIQSYAKMIGLVVWMKNIFVPMYGTRDWQSRIISFFVRVFQIIARSIILIVWSLIMLLFVVAYVSLPVLSLFGALFHMSAFVI